MFDLLKNKLVTRYIPEHGHHDFIQPQNGWRHYGAENVFVRDVKTENGSHIEKMYVERYETYVKVDGEEIARMDTTLETVHEYMNNHPDQRDEVEAAFLD